MVVAESINYLFDRGKTILIPFVNLGPQMTIFVNVITNFIFKAASYNIMNVRISSAGSIISLTSDKLQNLSGIIVNNNSHFFEV